MKTDIHFNNISLNSYQKENNFQKKIVEKLKHIFCSLTLFSSFIYKEIL